MPPPTHSIGRQHKQPPCAENHQNDKHVTHPSTDKPNRTTARDTESYIDFAGRTNHPLTPPAAVRVEASRAAQSNRVNPTGSNRP